MPKQKITPQCPVFGQCGGCLYQDIPYEEELRIKETNLKTLLQSRLNIADELFEPITASPRDYHYRNRLDLKLVCTKEQGVLIGFSSEGRNNIIPIEACPIAQQEISAYLPKVKREAINRLTPKYKMANLVVKTGEDGRVAWGGIGRRSLQMKEEDYLWTEIAGKKIFYSLDTFFQAIRSILPLSM